MNFEVRYSPVCVKAAKRLSRKYPSIRKDLSTLIEHLEQDPERGTPLGQDCYKVRMVIASKGKGKSGGARVITCVKVIRRTVILLTLYDKADTDTISDKELKRLLELVG